MNKNESLITNNKIEKIQNKKEIRKQIKNIMNLDDLKNFIKLSNIDSIISLYSSKKSYISPELKLLPRKKKIINNNSKEIIKKKISPNKKPEIKKYNYKKKIVINKEKLNKKKENNLIFGELKDLMDDNVGTFDNNSLEKENQNQNKLKIYIGNKINNNDKNKNNKNNNNIFDMGSISHISKNGSSSGKEKNIIEEDIKNNNNPFEKIVCDFIEVENCKNLFNESQENRNEINKEENPINDQYKSRALKEILNNENNDKKEEIKITKNNPKNNNKKEYDKLIMKFIDEIITESEDEIFQIEKFVNNIIKDSENEVIQIEKFAKDIISESKNESNAIKNFVNEIFSEAISNASNKNPFDEAIKEEQKEEKNINNNINIMNYKKISDVINSNEENDNEKKILGNNSETKIIYRTLGEENEKNNEKNILLQSQENKDMNSMYKKNRTIQGVSKNYRFGYLRKNSLRREYQQKKYNTLNSNNSN